MPPYHRDRIILHEITNGKYLSSGIAQQVSRENGAVPKDEMGRCGLIEFLGPGRRRNARTMRSKSATASGYGVLEPGSEAEDERW
jgi:hypothetical protein